MQSDVKESRAKVVPIKANTSLSAAERAKLARLPAPVHSVQEKGKQQLSRALRTLFDNTDDALFALADKATSNQEQNLYFESMREVRIRRRQLESAFADSIDQAFTKLILQDTSSASSIYGDDNISTDSLSLVEDDELEELVAVDSMIAKANTACGESLQYFSLRLDSLVPNKVYQKTNPLGPDVVCNAFVDAARDLDADIKAKLVLFKLFDHYVVSELPAVYDQLNTTLIEHNVLPSLQHRKPRPQNASGSPTGAASAGTAGQPTGAQTQPVHGQAAHGQAAHTQGQANPQGGAVAQGHASQGYSSQGNASQGSGGQAGPMVHGGPGAAPVSGNELVGALTQIQGQQTAQWGQSGGEASVAAVQTDISGLLMKLLEEQHGQRSMEQSQTETINLVKLLFEFILDDRSLAEPMKALIGRLQIPILKVALLDKTFFNKSGHPARRLLNEMATASLGWQPDPKNEGVPKDPLYRKIDASVHRLLNEFEADVSLFKEVLADFVSFVEKERKRASVLEQRTIDAEDGKAKAEAARKQVNAALEEVVAGRSLPPAVQKILDDAWSNALFLICLKQGRGSEEWQQALQTAEDLIWSVNVDVTPESRQKLLGMIPHLVKRLREGLEKISFNPFEMTQLLNRLEKLHLARLQRIGKSQSAAQAPASPAKSEAKAEDEAEVKSEAKSPAAKDERKNQAQVAEKPQRPATAASSGKQETEQKPAEKPAGKTPEAAQPASAETASEASNPNIDSSYLALTSKLTQGTWFDMIDSAGQHYRCRLAAIIKATGKYIFVNRNGMKVAEETRESLALAMKEDKLSLLDDTMLFDRALESVIGSMRKSSR